MTTASQPPTGIRWQRWAIGALIAIVVLSAASYVLGLYLSPIAKREITQALRDRFQSDLEIGDLSVSFFPTIRATGENLVFRHHGRTDVPPLIKMKRFTASAGWVGGLMPTHRVRRVTLEGLEIRVAKAREDDKDAKHDQGKSGDAPEKSAFVIQEIVADGTLLQILPDEPDKDPLEFDIYRLTLEAVRADGPMEYKAQLRNAKPPGLIHADGKFGPWAAGDPGQTPLDGDYRFDNADLGVFKGIAGRLSSTGHFEGKLRRIEAQGTTDTPDFTVRAAGHPIHLRTEYSATIDGTNGNTYLHPVTAHFLNSTVVASGGVASKAKGQGKTVTLDAQVDSGRLEDMLHLAVDGHEPVMRGGISFKSKLIIPPGDIDVVDKIYLNGKFSVSNARFTDIAVQDKVGDLSKRAQGDPEAPADPSVRSDFNGQFVVDNGTIQLSGLIFRIPGAIINLDGSYGLTAHTLDFQGTARLEARMSELTTGWKSAFLKVIDPIFKRKSTGAVVPIRITGTRKDPQFGLNLKP